MDFIKGIPHKLIALEKLLLDHPSWASKIVLVQAHLGELSRRIISANLDHPSWASKIVLVQAHHGDYLGELSRRSSVRFISAIISAVISVIISAIISANNMRRSPRPRAATRRAIRSYRTKFISWWVALTAVSARSSTRRFITSTRYCHYVCIRPHYVCLTPTDTWHRASRPSTYVPSLSSLMSLLSHLIMYV